MPALLRYAHAAMERSGRGAPLSRGAVLSRGARAPLASTAHGTRALAGWSAALLAALMALGLWGALAGGAGRDLATILGARARTAPPPVASAGSERVLSLLPTPGPGGRIGRGRRLQPRLPGQRVRGSATGGITRPASAHALR